MCCLIGIFKVLATNVHVHTTDLKKKKSCLAWFPGLHVGNFELANGICVA